MACGPCHAGKPSTHSVTSMRHGGGCCCSGAAGCAPPINGASADIAHLQAIPRGAEVLHSYTEPKSSFAWMQGEVGAALRKAAHTVQSSNIALLKCRVVFQPPLVTPRTALASLQATDSASQATWQTGLNGMLWRMILWSARRHRWRGRRRACT